jgi:serine/threonine protein phosphatase PrpC
MFCPSCNAPNREDAKFCKSCGHSLRVEQAATPEQVSGSGGANGSGSTPESAAPASTAPTPEEGAQQVTTSAPAESAGSAQAPASAQTPAPRDEEPVSAPEDPALAPTLILSPDKVLAYRSRFWSQEQPATGEASQGAQQQSASSETALSGTTAETHAQEPAPHIADQPTVVMQPVNEQQPTSANNSQLADQPTLQMSGLTESGEGSAPGAPVSAAPGASAAPSAEQSAPPAFDGQPAPALEESAEQKEASQPMTDQTASEEASQTEQQQQAASVPGGAFAPLAVGETLIGRYEITHILSETPEEHTYQVIDHQGSQHCWNCGSEQNAEGDEFCIDCGASMLDVPYVLHEYPASGGPATEANLFQGSIVNTFIDKDRTYAVEQPAINQSPFPQGVQLLAASNSDAGNVRRSEPNEDSTLVLQLQRVHESQSTPCGIFIVADGLGGHDNGQVASRMTVNIIAERMTRELLGLPLQQEREGAEVKALDEDDLVGLLRNTIEEANASLCQKNQRDKTDMGSTLTGYMIVNEQAYIVNVGDSRTYMVRGGQIYQLTTDHSLVGQLVAGGLIEPDDVYTHPQRSQIFRSLGDKPNVAVDVFKQQLLPGDILLSCSDGLWEMVRNPQIESILNNAPDPQTACARLIDAANTNGGEDNVSAVVTFVRG